MKKFFLLIIVSLLFVSSVYAQPEIKVQGYVDTYYATDNSVLMGDHSMRSFSVVNGMKDQFGLNIGMLSVSGETDRFRGNVTFQKGDLPSQAYSGHTIQQAFAGVQLFENFWMDAGYFGTHIGGESLLPVDNWLSSHSMVTYMEPFYHAGVKFNYQVNDNIDVGLHILNQAWGYSDNNFNKTFGLTAGYSTDDLSVSYAGMYGNEEDGKPQNAKLYMYHNVCLGYDGIENMDIKAQLDMATLEDGVYKDGDYEQGSFMGFSLQGRYHFQKNFKATARFAYFMDADGIQGVGCNGLGITGGVEYNPTDNTYLRAETRMLNFSNNEADGSGDQFYDGEENTNSRMELMLNFGIYLDIFTSK